MYAHILLIELPYPSFRLSVTFFYQIQRVRRTVVATRSYCGALWWSKPTKFFAPKMYRHLNRILRKNIPWKIISCMLGKMRWSLLPCRSIFHLSPLFEYLNSSDHLVPAVSLFSGIQFPCLEFWDIFWQMREPWLLWHKLFNIVENTNIKNHSDSSRVQDNMTERYFMFATEKYGKQRFHIFSWAAHLLV